MAAKVFVEINNDAYVEEGGKQIIGTYECSIEEGKRLVEKLKVAKYSKVKNINNQPTKDSKVEIIKEWLDKKNIAYKASASKEELLALMAENPTK